ncbi:CoA transferase [Seohaeicola zhoushanensis]
METGADIPHDRPLAGLRILEMAALGPLPLAGTLLAGFGADVVRSRRNRTPTSRCGRGALSDSI